MSAIGWRALGSDDRRSRRRRWLAVACTGPMLVAACSQGEDATPADTSTTTATTTGDGSSDASTTTTTADRGVGDPTQGDGDAGPVVDTAGARAALDRYLDALAGNDFLAALTWSTDELQSLALVRSIIHTSNADKGGVTRSSFADRRFDVADSAPDEVRFSGRAVLTSSVSGPAGPPSTTTDSFEDIVVRRGPDGWRAAAATYGDRPLVAFLARASTSAGPVQLTLIGSLAFGSSVAVIVQVDAQGDASVGVDETRLRVGGDLEADASTAFAVSGQPGYLYSTFPRHDGRPTQWRATVTVDGREHDVALTF